MPIAFGVSYGTTLGRLGKWDEAIPALTEATQQAVVLKNEFLNANANHQLARALLGSGQLDQVAPKLDIAEKVWMANETANRDRLGDLLRTRAELAMAQRDTNAAKQAIDAALIKLGYGASGDLAPGLVAALTCASKIYVATGDAARATTFARDALATAERIARDPAQSADVGEALALGKAQQAQNDASASATLARANETLRRSLGMDRGT